MAASGNTATSTFIKQEPGLGVTIKQEPGLIKSERLTSIRLKRDLTLGGINPARLTRNPVNRKVFTPNLNAIRNKNADVKTSRDTTATNLRGRGRGGDRSKAPENSRGGRGGRGGKNANLVQTSGLFSEGSGETKLRKSSAVFDKSSSNDNASALRRPTLVKREVKIDPEVEKKHLQEIFGDIDDEEMDGDNRLDYLMENFAPICLHDTKSEVKSEIKSETVKTESPTQYPYDLDEFFTRNQPQLFLLQLPDSLPGHGPDMEPADSAASEKRTLSDDPAAYYCTMRHLDEGLLGKVVRYKSGKTKLVIGNARFDIDLGMDPGLLQEVISVDTNAADRSGNLINLGQLQAKLSAIPDWEYIFSSSSKEES